MTGSAGAFLAHLIDYAGIFPPAALDLGSAVRNYLAYSRGAESWMLGRFVIPASRIAEMQACAAGERVQATALIGAAVEADVAAAEAARIDVVECKAATPADVEVMRKRIPGGMTCYFEIPFAQAPLACVEAIAAVGARAKIRTGGLTPDAVPSTVQVARFLQACAQCRVPFKATAGLHHPIRSAAMHGFLNVFLAAAFLRHGMEQKECLALLDDVDATALRFDAEAIEWRGHRLTKPQIEEARRSAGIAFGSCSFEEPIEDLKALRIL